MTYCLAITLNSGLVFASDSRTNAGVDYVTTYSKMQVFEEEGERYFVLLAAGNLATSQAVANRLRRDFEDEDAAVSLNTMEHLFDAAHYVGEISHQVQNEYADVMEKSKTNVEASFILGGQINGGRHEIYLVYPQANVISASPETPYLQIGESKYGKPILDRIIESSTTLEDAARCALVSLDSTMRSNISVGAPFELLIYRKDSFETAHYMNLKLHSPYYASLRKRWDEGLKRALQKLPRFDWE